MANRPEMFGPTMEFSGWPIQWNHAKCFGADPCCHGNEIWARRGCPVAYRLVVIRPPVRSNERTYKMLVMFLFFLTRNLRDPSADHRETLPHDWKLVLFYNPTSKNSGLSPQKIWGPKTCKISVHFTQPPTLIANISGTA